ncbi:MAG: magnesium protoporphyrin IX methyltransferase [Pseudomonadota bacterium]
MSETQITPVPGLTRDLLAEPAAVKITTPDEYLSTRNRVAHYFDRTATRAWAQLTSDAPVSGIRATVRAGRDQMRALILGQLPADLTGARILDAGCGTGAFAFELAARGADVVGVDISPQLIAIAQTRRPAPLERKLRFQTGDMLDDRLGAFDFVVAMDSMIYYRASDIARSLSALAPRIDGKMVLTIAPRTLPLLVMWRLGKLLPRSDRSPNMVPHTCKRIARQLQTGSVRDVGRINSGFYISNALVFRP